MPLAAAYGLQPARAGGAAVIEAALAVGMARVPEGGLDPLGASSGGLGELLAEARQAGATRLEATTLTSFSCISGDHAYAGRARRTASQGLSRFKRSERGGGDGGHLHEFGKAD